MNGLAPIEKQEVSAEVTDMGTAMVSMIERVVMDPNIPIDRLEKMMEMQERWTKAQAEKAFEAAISDAKSELKPIAKNKDGHNSRYANMAAIAEVVDPIITKYGLAYRFETEQDESIKVTCVLSHRDGYKIRNTIAAGADTSGSKNSIQAIGSTLTYLQRYSLIQALGLATDDDDDGKKSVREFITENQLDEITKLIADTATDIGRFLKYGRIPSLDEMLAKDFESAKAQIKTAANTKAKKAAAHSKQAGGE